MDIESSFEMDAQFAETGEPGVRAHRVADRTAEAAVSCLAKWAVSGKCPL